MTKERKKVAAGIAVLSLLSSMFMAMPVLADSAGDDMPNAPLGVYYNVNNWDGYTKDDFSITYSDEAKEGNYSLNINNINEVANRKILTKVPLKTTIKTGDTYKISFWIKTTNTEGGYALIGSSEVALTGLKPSAVNEWVYCETETTLTADATGFQFSTWKHQRYIDDLCICKKNADGTYGENVVLNGNFETIKVRNDNTKTPIGWSTKYNGPKSSTMASQNTFIARSDADSHSGDYAMLVNVQQELDNTSFFVQTAMDEGLENGTPYRLEVYIKNIEDSPRASIRNSGGNLPNGWGALRKASGTLDKNEWYKVTLDFNGDSAEDEIICFSFWPQGAAFIDDVSVYELDSEGNPTGENRIINGGFEAVNESGFSQETRYLTNKPFTVMPKTIEATINVQAEQRGRVGVILGNYWYNMADCFNLEINTYGNPRLYAIDKACNVYEIVFDEIDVRTGEDVHLAVSIDTENSLAHCYVNGELAQTKTGAFPDSIAFKYGTAIGSDTRAGNDAYFKGYIRDVAVYSDVRTAEKIASDTKAETVDSSELIAAWTVTENTSVLSDISGNGYDMVLTDATKWIKEEPALDDYAYSFAVVGDTQMVNELYPDKFEGIYNWIIDNAEKYNTKFVMGLGDITDDDLDTEYERAKSAIQKMDGVVPYSIVRGNHDSKQKYTTYFSFDEFGTNVDGSYSGDMLNTYQTFSVGDIKYLVLNLDYLPSDEVITWANEIVESHPDYNVIITTHAYLFKNGEILDDANGGFHPVTSGGDNAMWENLVRKHENIVLVLSGHITSNRIVVTPVLGDNGNTVTQILIDPQDVDAYYSESEGAGLVAMFHFSEDGKTVQVRYYSTIKEAYFLAENQFTMTLDVVGTEEEPVAPEFLIGSMSFNINMSGSTDGKLIAALYDEEGKLLNCKSYNVASNVTVSFDNCADTDTVKLFWWNEKTLLPVTIAQKLNIIQ